MQGLKQRLAPMSRQPPDDELEAWILHEDIDETGENFLAVFSTVELRSNAALGNGEMFFHLDGCFNVMKEGFDCLVLATGDMSHAVLPLANCIGTLERKAVFGVRETEG